MVPAGIEIFPFAVLGFLVGRLYLALGVGALVLIFVPILIGREVFRSYMRITEARDETVHMLIRASSRRTVTPPVMPSASRSTPATSAKR